MHTEVMLSKRTDCHTRRECIELDFCRFQAKQLNLDKSEFVVADGSTFNIKPYQT